jgi:hypothetical protein
MRFESQEETTKHLEDLKESGEKQVNRLKEDKSKLQKEFEEMKYSGEARLSRYVFETLDFAGFELLCRTRTHPRDTPAICDKGLWDMGAAALLLFPSTVRQLRDKRV